VIEEPKVENTACKEAWSDGLEARPTRVGRKRGLEVEFFGVGGVGVFGPAAGSGGGLDELAVGGVDGEVCAAGSEAVELS